MLLSMRDIEHLVMKGFDKDSFVRFDLKGYATLRNYHGYCFFYDAEKKRCKVHTHRPLGCRLYPIIYHEGKGIMVDAICPSSGSVTDKQKSKRGKKVIKLLKTIDAEAKKRRLARLNQGPS